METSADGHSAQNEDNETSNDEKGFYSKGGEKEDIASSENLQCLAIYDPPKWGWAATGGIIDLLPPIDRARRIKFIKKSVKIHKRKRSAIILDNKQSETKTQSESSNSDDGKPEKHSTALHEQVLMNSCGSGEFEWNKTGENNVEKNCIDCTKTSCILKKAEAENQNEALKSAILEKDNNPNFKMQTKCKGNTENKAIKDKEIDKVDIYKYHRGRVGEEPRSEVTGKLFCDVKETDTNWNWNPNLIVQVLVRFPLSDGSYENEAHEQSERQQHKAKAWLRTLKKNEVDHEGESYLEMKNHNSFDDIREKSSTQQEYFSQLIPWDLQNPETPSPMMFAMTTAAEYGLNCDVAISLSNSIQQQINNFLAATVYKPPLTLTDPFGIKRPSNDPISIPPASQKRGRNSRVGTTPSNSAKARNVKGTPRSFATRSVRRYVHKFKSDKKYRVEIHQRLQIESKEYIRRVCKKQKKIIGKPKIVKNLICHVCHYRKDVGAQFPCGITSHIYCKNHCSARLGLDVDRVEQDNICLDSCPICSLTCDCAKCIRQLDKVTLKFESDCNEQNTSPDKCKFDALHAATNGSVSVQDSAGSGTNLIESVEGRTSKRKQSHSNIRNECSNEAKSARDTSNSVSYKVDRSYFPIEVFGHQNIDPADEKDYRTIFGPNGVIKIVQTSQKDKELIAHHMEMESKNLDFCWECRKGGNLVCCEKCPRSFHVGCIRAGFDERINMDCWVCEYCIREQYIEDEDYLNETESLPSVLSGFHSLNYVPNFTLKIGVLAKMHQMLLKLMKSEFGHLFRQPVNTKEVPDYTSTIKNPIDLGTIAKKMIHGDYVKTIDTTERNFNEFEHVFFNILKDVELVWHNCFTYNEKNTQCHSMGMMVRSKYLKFKKCNFDAVIGEKVCKKIEELVQQFEMDRRAQDDLCVNQTPSTKTQFIVVKNHPRGIGRKVCAFDSDTCRVVKVYTTNKAAVEAMQNLSLQGNKSEFPISDVACRKLIKDGLNDPHLKCFGYRWLYFDELKKGGVIKFPDDFDEERVLNTDSNSEAIDDTKQESDSQNFVETNDSAPKVPQNFVERFDGTKKTIYRSLHEAYKHGVNVNDKAIKDLSFEDFEAILCGSEIDEHIRIGKYQWKILYSKTSRQIKFNVEEKSMRKRKKVDKISRQRKMVHLNDNVFFNNDGIQSTSSAQAIVKQDLVSCAILCNFETLESAYEDWRTTLQHAKYDAEPRGHSMDVFTTFYLNGDENLYGVRWRTRPNPSEISSSVETTTKSHSINAKAGGVKIQLNLHGINGTNGTNGTSKNIDVNANKYIEDETRDETIPQNDQNQPQPTEALDSLDVETAF